MATSARQIIGVGLEVASGAAFFSGAYETELFPEARKWPGASHGQADRHGGVRARGRGAELHDRGYTARHVALGGQQGDRGARGPPGRAPAQPHHSVLVAGNWRCSRAAGASVARPRFAISRAAHWSTSSLSPPFVAPSTTLEGWAEPGTSYTRRTSTSTRRRVHGQGLGPMLAGSRRGRSFGPLQRRQLFGGTDGTTRPCRGSARGRLAVTVRRSDRVGA